MQRKVFLLASMLAILQNFVVNAHFLLQISDLRLIACILSHTVTSHVPEELHSDPQTAHQVHLPSTTHVDSSASIVVLNLTANVRSDVLLHAFDMFVVQRFVVGDLDLTLRDLVFELYIVSHEWSGVRQRNNLRLQFGC